MRNLVFDLQIIGTYKKNKVVQWVSLCCSLGVEWVIVMSVLHLNSMIGISLYTKNYYEQRWFVKVFAYITKYIIFS